MLRFMEMMVMTQNSKFWFNLLKGFKRVTVETKKADVVFQP